MIELRMHVTLFIICYPLDCLCNIESIGIALLQMLCEEQGFFLEIIDIIRHFGLNILKAKMERRRNKLWARFIVEVDPIFDCNIRIQIINNI